MYHRLKFILYVMYEYTVDGLLVAFTQHYEQAAAAALTAEGWRHVLSLFRTNYH